MGGELGEVGKCSVEVGGMKEDVMGFSALERDRGENLGDSDLGEEALEWDDEVWTFTFLPSKVSGERRRSLEVGEERDEEANECSMDA